MRYSEADTRSKFIDPKLYEQGWQEAHIVRERSFTDGRKLPGGKRAAPLFLDYLLKFHGINLAIIEAKKYGLAVTEGLEQVKNYGNKLGVTTEMLFLQHFMKKMKVGARAAIIVPEGVLFNTSNAFQEVKKQLLADFDLHTIVSLPAGIFLPYSGVKTNIIFFDKTKSTEQIRYYEIDLGRKLTKNKPITFEELQPLISAFKKREIGSHSWVVPVDQIKDFDLSAKNPSNIKEIIHRAPREIMQDILARNESIIKQVNYLESLLK